MGKLIYKYITRQLTPVQEKTLTAWRNLSIENEIFFQEETNLKYIRKRLKVHNENKILIWQKLKQTFPDTWKPLTSKNHLQ